METLINKDSLSCLANSFARSFRNQLDVVQEMLSFDSGSIIESELHLLQYDFCKIKAIYEELKSVCTEEEFDIVFEWFGFIEDEIFALKRKLNSWQRQAQIVPFVHLSGILAVSEKPSSLFSNLSVKNPTEIIEAESVDLEIESCSQETEPFYEEIQSFHQEHKHVQSSNFEEYDACPSIVENGGESDPLNSAESFTPVSHLNIVPDVPCEYPTVLYEVKMICPIKSEAKSHQVMADVTAACIVNVPEVTHEEPDVVQRIRCPEKVVKVIEKSFGLKFIEKVTKRTISVIRLINVIRNEMGYMNLFKFEKRLVWERWKFDIRTFHIVLQSFHNHVNSGEVIFIFLCLLFTSLNGTYKQSSSFRFLKCHAMIFHDLLNVQKFCKFDFDQFKVCSELDNLCKNTVNEFICLHPELERWFDPSRGSQVSGDFCFWKDEAFIFREPCYGRNPVYFNILGLIWPFAQM